MVVVVVIMIAIAIVSIVVVVRRVSDFQRFLETESQNSFCGDANLPSARQYLRAGSGGAPRHCADRGAFPTSGNGSDDGAENSSAAGVLARLAIGRRRGAT